MMHITQMTQQIGELAILPDEEIELDRAALSLSALDHQGADLISYEQVLDNITERLRVVGADAETLEEQASALQQVFAVEYGFAGDFEAYGAPVNADLIRVIDRRRGLPVILAILYVSAARRLGWPAYALNTPGHVLVRLGDERFMLLDPFFGGVPVSSDRLKELVAGNAGYRFSPLDRYLQPVPNRLILVRLLQNQATRAEESGDLPRAITVRERMTQVAPEYPDLWWELARLHLLKGDNAEARSALYAMLEITREPDQRQRIIRTLESLSSNKS